MAGTQAFISTSRSKVWILPPLVNCLIKVTSFHIFQFLAHRNWWLKTVLLRPPHLNLFLQVYFASSLKTCNQMLWLSISLLADDNDGILFSHLVETIGRQNKIFDEKSEVIRFQNYQMLLQRKHFINIGRGINNFANSFAARWVQNIVF